MSQAAPIRYLNGSVGFVSQLNHVSL